MAHNTDDKRDVHETLLPSLTLSILGGVGPTENLTPLPGDLIRGNDLSLAQPVPLRLQSDDAASGSRPRGARAGDIVGGRYVVDGQIGRGGMGRVLRVRHQVLGKAFALKLIKAPIATDPRIREMFYREARLASALSHDNICSIVDFGQDPSFGLFMVMELLDGSTVHHKLRHDGRMAPKVACDIMWQIGEAVRYIHSRSILHGDIKSENVLLTRTPERRRLVKLLDFGLARANVAYAHGHVEGTPEYLAPERIKGAPASVASDIYALGIVFYELLTGRLPFTGSIEDVFKMHLESAVPAPSRQVDEAIDERADEIVARATARNPEDRHPDVAGLLYELRTLMNMLGMETGRRRTSAPEGGAARRRDVDHTIRAASEVFEFAPVPLASVDVQGEVRVANQAFLEFLGVAGRAAGIQLKDSGILEVYPQLMADLRATADQRHTIKRIIYLSEGGGTVVEVAVVMNVASALADVTAGEIHIALHPLGRLVRSA
jgi:PAS domain-containing protein